jgi:hypothetical protein
MYRPAVIAASSALEVALKEQFEEMDISFLQRPRSVRSPAPMARLLGAALDLELITHEEYKELLELQRVRNVLVHTADTIDGRRARPLVLRTTRVVSRLRARATDHQAT